MKVDTKRPNGTIKRIQYVRAFRGGTSSMGRRYKKGDPIIHLSSSRNTGETFVLLPKEVTTLAFRHFRTPSGLTVVQGLKRPGRWNSPKKWGEELKAEWTRKFEKIHGHKRGESCVNHPPEFWKTAKQRWKELNVEESITE